MARRSSRATAYRYAHHPKTGRFGGPAQAWHGALTVPEARLSVGRLDIWGSHTYRYVVRSASVVTPDDVRLLNAPYMRSTRALRSP